MNALVLLVRGQSSWYDEFYALLGFLGRHGSEEVEGVMRDQTETLTVGELGINERKFDIEDIQSSSRPAQATTSILSTTVAVQLLGINFSIKRRRKMPECKPQDQNFTMIATHNIISPLRLTRNQSRAAPKSPKSTPQKRKRRHDPWTRKRRKSQRGHVHVQDIQADGDAGATETDPNGMEKDEEGCHGNAAMTLDKPAKTSADISNLKIPDHGPPSEASETLVTLTEDDEKTIENRETLMNLIDLTIQVLNLEIEDLKTNNGDSDSSHDSLFDGSDEGGEPQEEQDEEKKEEEAKPEIPTDPSTKVTLHERSIATTDERLSKRRVMHRRQRQYLRYISPPDSPIPAGYVGPPLRATEVHPALRLVPPSPPKDSMTNLPAFIDYRSEASTFHKTLAPWRTFEMMKRA
ncbi:MAG: hypothetical protein Q9174_001508 [Haloplaca sp. 1 TL-2023]